MIEPASNQLPQNDPLLPGHAAPLERQSGHEIDLANESVGLPAPASVKREDAPASALPPSQQQSSGLSGQDLLDIRSALRLSFRLFDEQRRSWGPSETLPLSAHTSEVGMLLLASGEKRCVIIAGFLHDLFEGYIKTDRAELEARVRNKFGDEVVRLIESVTEPPKSALPGNWAERKSAVLEKLEKEDRDAATLSCATKISTIAAGNKYLRMGRPLSEWSAGGAQENLDVFEKHLELYARKGVTPALLEQFDLELSLFALRQGLARKGSC